MEKRSKSITHPRNKKAYTLYKSLYQKTSPKNFSLLNPLTWLPTPNKTAYLYITLHGGYDFQFNNPEKIPKNLRDLPTERYLEPTSTFRLNETGIKTLKWVRAVPGAVCNITAESEIDEYYDIYSAKVKLNDSDHIPLYTRDDDDDDDDYPQNYTNYTKKDFLETQYRHNESLYFTNDDEIINKKFVVTQQEIKETMHTKDYKIWLMNNDTNITEQVLDLSLPHNLFLGHLKNILTWLKYHGFEHVVLIDLSCAAVKVGSDTLEGIHEAYYTRFAGRDINMHGGKNIKKLKKKKSTRKSTHRRRTCHKTRKGQH
jgi:hypothetical protein